MTKTKRRHPDADEILARPWCYYCERDFDDLKILISHQKAKHFKCDRCGRRLNTAGGLSVHLSQVHKETLTTVENALPTRKEPNIEIFAMEGIPEDIVQQHRQRVVQAYYEAQAERRAATGNPPPGGGPNAGGHKKPKIESADDLKERLKAFQAKKVGGEAMAEITNGATTEGVGQDGQTATQQIPPGFPPQPFPQPGFPSQSPFQQGPPGFGSLGQQAPPGIASFPPFSPPGQLPFQQLPVPFSHPQAGSPLQASGLGRPPTLPPAPGLPQRPTFAVPSVNHFQMQALHQGQTSPAAPPAAQVSQDPRKRSQDTAPAAAAVADAPIPTATAAAVDKLIAGVAGDDGEAKMPAEVAPASAPDKKARKEKDRDKAMQLVYSDNEVSPEEKMARLGKYAFDPKKHEEEAPLGPVEAAVTGPEVGGDDVIDRQG